MTEFSIEKISEQIHFGKTKEYFREVFSSYQNENYRSAVVMLWSVVICDILYKLQHLVDLYDDGAAKKILQDVENAQNDDARSSSWEIKLVEDAHNQTELLDSSEYENLCYLQKQRHLCAHPVLNNDSELHSPNKETVRSLLRNALEDLLIKPPFYTQRIFNELLDDVSENTAALNTKRKLKQYIESRYLERLSENVEIQIFRSLWKLVFKTQNEQCDKNRKINFQTLEVISERKSNLIKEAVSGETDFYSNIASAGYPLDFLIVYLSKYPILFETLNEDAKIKIRHGIETTDVGKSMGWFVKDSLDQHFNDVLEWIEGDERPIFLDGQWDAVFEINDSDEWQECFCKLVGAYYASSRSFDQADLRFSDCMLVYIDRFNERAFKFTLEKAESNSQTYNRGHAAIDHAKVKEAILDVKPDFTFEIYPNFSSSVRDNELDDVAA